MGYEKIETEMWLPTEAGQELEGTVESINAEGLYGNQYHVKKTDGKTTVTPSHKVLQNRMVSVKVGDKIKVVYNGEEPPKIKGQNPTKMYDVYKDE